MELNKNIFREYDIRGVYPTDINADVAYRMGRSYGSYLQEKYNNNRCVIGYDNRLSSRELNEYLIKGLLESGCDIINIGLCTTPTLYYARYLYNRPGIMISASHNPKEDNGFKFSLDSPINASGEEIKNFMRYTLANNFRSGQGTYRFTDLTDEYVSYLQKDIKMGKRNLKVVVDCGNGTASIIDEKAFDIYAFEVKYIFTSSDGTFPHHHPDPNVEENLERLKEVVLNEKADIGIAFDGDEDRLGVIAGDGSFIEPDKLMIIFIRDLINKVNNKTFLYDVKCSKSLSDEIIALGATPICYRTGASYTSGKVIEEEIPFGGEYSGHLYFNDGKYPIGSGIMAGLRLLEILSNSECSLIDLLKGITHYINSPEERVEVADEVKFAVIDKVKKYCKEKNYQFLDIDGVRVEFSDGWALVRASNTGPNLSCRFEALTKERLEELMREFKSLIDKIINKGD